MSSCLYAESRLGQAAGAEAGRVVVGGGGSHGYYGVESDVPSFSHFQLCVYTAALILPTQFSYVVDKLLGR